MNSNETLVFSIFQGPNVFSCQNITAVERTYILMLLLLQGDVWFDNIKNLGQYTLQYLLEIVWHHLRKKSISIQCLLDTPRTERVSEKTWQVILAQTSRPCFLKEDFSRICANKNYKLLHAYVICVYIVSAKYAYTKAM